MVRQIANIDAFPSSNVFDTIASVLTGDAALTKKTIKQTNAVIQFTLKNKEGKSQSWVLDLKNDGTLKKGAAEKADITLILSDEHFGQLVAGKANAQKLFMSGKLKVKGNVMKAASIEPILKSARSKL